MGKFNKQSAELKTGLFDDAEATIVAAIFGVNEEYAKASGKRDPGLTLYFGDSPSIDPSKLGEDRPHQFYSLGEGSHWQVVRNGLEVVSATKPDLHSFNASARGGMLVEAICKLFGEGDYDKGVARMEKEWGEAWMTEVAFFIGLRSHWKLLPRPSVGDPNAKVLLPTKFIKAAQVQLAASPASAPGAAPAASAAPPSPPPSASAPDPSTNGSLSADALDVILLTEILQPGMTPMALKIAASKDARVKGNKEYAAALIQGSHIGDLETAGLLTKGADGKYTK